MTGLSREQIEEWVAAAQDAGEHVVIFAAPDRIDAYNVPKDGFRSLTQAARAWAAG